MQPVDFQGAVCLPQAAAGELLQGVTPRKAWDTGMPPAAIADESSKGGAGASKEMPGALAQGHSFAQGFLSFLQAPGLQPPFAGPMVGLPGQQCLLRPSVPKVPSALQEAMLPLA